MRRFEVDEATLVRDSEIPTLDETLNNPQREGCELVDIVPIYGFGRVKVVWRWHELAEEKSKP